MSYNGYVSTPILATKIYIPSSRSNIVLRPRLIDRLNKGLQHTSSVTLISAPAGFGKTTLVSEWIADCERPAAWLSLDEGDNDPTRFLAYLVAALQTIAGNIGEGVLAALHASQLQPPPIESVLTELLNEITTIPANFILVLDDYHVIDSKPIDHAVTFLLEHQPPQVHLVIITREDPDLPLARLRAQGKMTELRALDLRFTTSEGAEFLNRIMGLNLVAEDIAALETRTEGWIAGLQLAAISMQGHQDAASFIQSFTGSHHFVMDYLVEEVLQQQSESVQMFLIKTSILDRLCGPLCDAVLLDSSAPGQETLEYLERANLFIIPLDNERRWYRYHHLFADLLRQRLHQSFGSTAGSTESRVYELHIHASQWFEDNDLVMEAFRHAAAAKDIERAERLIDGKGIPLHFSGGVTPILGWLESLPPAVMNARPSLWWRHAAMLLINGQTIGVAEKLQSAETALSVIWQGAEPDEKTRGLIGQIAAATATLALTRYDIDTMIAQSHRALEYLHPGNLFTRATANWTLGYAYLLRGERVEARLALTESISLSQAAGAVFSLILATIGLGNVQEVDNELHQAAETYQRVLQWVGDKPQQIIGEAHLGLARVLYEWNDLEAAQQHGEQSLQLAKQYERVIDRFLISEVFLARLKLAQGDVESAASILAQADQSARQQNFVHRIPEIAAVQVLTLIRQGNQAAAAHLAQTHKLPISQAHVHLAQEKPSDALAVLDSWDKHVDAMGWKDERLKVLLLQAVSHQALGKDEKALHLLSSAMELAEPGGFIRIFVDLGAPMARLLSKMKGDDARMQEYVHKLLAAFNQQQDTLASSFIQQPLVEPLSQREMEVLQLIAQGLSNDEIGKRLFLALDTVKGHNRRIYDKLQVQRRTEAVARARQLGLL